MKPMKRVDEETSVVLVDGDSVPYRATYLIDEDGMVFHEGVNHMPIGRNVDRVPPVYRCFYS